jgi:hypothetical protein
LHQLSNRQKQRVADGIACWPTLIIRVSFSIPAESEMVDASRIGERARVLFCMHMYPCLRILEHNVESRRKGYFMQIVTKFLLAPPNYKGGFFRLVKLLAFHCSCTLGMVSSEQNWF